MFDPIQTQDHFLICDADHGAVSEIQAIGESVKGKVGEWGRSRFFGQDLEVEVRGANCVSAQSKLVRSNHDHD
jgi:hypothetical protein